MVIFEINFPNDILIVFQYLYGIDFISLFLNSDSPKHVLFIC